MNGMDSFLLGKAMAENAQSLHSMFAGQRAAADRRTNDQLLNTLHNQSEQFFTEKWVLTAEKQALFAMLKHCASNGGVINEDTWKAFYDTYNNVQKDAPDRIPLDGANTFAKKVHKALSQ